jgi:hypothetical protein
MRLRATGRPTRHSAQKRPGYATLLKTEPPVVPRGTLLRSGRGTRRFLRHATFCRYAGTQRCCPFAGDVKDGGVSSEEHQSSFESYAVPARYATEVCLLGR